jgi:hypothetical protein
VGVGVSPVFLTPLRGKVYVFVLVLIGFFQKNKTKKE